MMHSAGNIVFFETVLQRLKGIYRHSMSTLLSLRFWLFFVFLFEMFCYVQEIKLKSKYSILMHASRMAELAFYCNWFQRGSILIMQQSWHFWWFNLCKYMEKL